MSPNEACSGLRLLRILEGYLRIQMSTSPARAD